jgi:predicted dehydrogenase
MEPVEAEVLASEAGDPLVRQIRQFARVIRDGEAPLVPGEEGLKTLRVVEAIKKSASVGGAVLLEGIGNSS